MERRRERHTGVGVQELENLGVSKEAASFLLGSGSVQQGLDSTLGGSTRRDTQLIPQSSGCLFGFHSSFQKRCGVAIGGFELQRALGPHFSLGEGQGKDGE